MKPEDWRKVDEIFQAALDCEPDRRAALLDDRCRGDAALREEVESLLRSSQDRSFTEAPAFWDGVRVLDRTQSLLGRHIGPYRLIREIGEGGMGVVYLAARADDVFEKQVAIKIVANSLTSEAVIQRFRSERQILANLDHPNITRLLDGGTTEDGLQFLVMEHIEGLPIDAYCDQKALGVNERLRLFQQVCAAVQYAHQHLIIHRDIKPANVLVTEEGTPRLLDFGIAKLLNPGPGAEAAGATGARLMTPEYASPEQVRGGPITTASDVYSLGVLLYRLLAGRSPYRGTMSSAGEIERAICEEQPEKPSAVARQDQAGAGKFHRQLQGDLDNIVLMALRKEPQRRYSSAEQFSQDIERYLANLPVIARPDARGYRAAKFIQRNKAWVAMAAVTFLSLSGGIAASLWQTHVAREERDLARVEQAKAARINAFLQDMVGYSSLGTGSSKRKYDATVAEMLDDAAQRVEKELDDQPAVKAELLETIGNTYMGQARIEPAVRYLGEAYGLNMKLYGPDSLHTAVVMVSLADLSYRKGDYAAADPWMQRAIQAFRKHVHDPALEMRLLVGTLSDAAFVKRALGQFDAAEALWREALSYAPKLPPQFRSYAMAGKTFLAQLYMDRGDVEKADPLAFEASRDLKAYGEDRFSLAQSLIDLGNVRRLERRYAEADALIQEGTKLYAQIQGADHPNVAYGLLSLATSYFYQGKYDASEKEARHAFDIVKKLPGTNYYASVTGLLGRIMYKAGRSREGEVLLREALEIRKKNLHRPSDLALAQGTLGECLLTEKRYAEAEPLLVKSYEALKTIQVARSPALEEARGRLDVLYAAWHKPAESLRSR